MGRLIYAAICSLDGYVEDERGEFGWAAPDEEVHGFVNDLERGTGTYLYGRRMWETMVFWQTAGEGEDDPAVFRDYAEIWRAAEKVVFSRTMAEPEVPRTRVEREFDPALVRKLKENSEADLSIGGAELAGQALAAGLVDAVQLIVLPEIVGGGKRALPDGLRASLELLDSRRFANGTAFLSYRIAA
jgi:dihydrofolate reductase